MHQYYYAILEAAFDLVEAQSALDHGCPAQQMKKRAFARLENACCDLAAENDGRMVLPDDDDLNAEVLRALRHAEPILARSPQLSTNCNGVGPSTTTYKALGMAQIALKKAKLADPDAYTKAGAKSGAADGGA